MGRDEAELPIMMESVRLWEKLAHEIDADVGFRREGSFYLCEKESDITRHDHFRSFAPNYGLQSDLINSTRLYDLIKNTPRHWVTALHTPTDGRAEPSIAVPAIAQACANKGVTIIENCAVRTISTTNQQIDGVHTEKGLIKCSAVLCCGGVWTSSFLNSCGFDMPQLAVKASVVSTANAPLITSGNASDTKLAIRRREDGGYTIAMTEYLEFFPTLHSLSQAKKF